MIIEDLIAPALGLSITETRLIRTECSQFIEEAAGVPLFKNLPVKYFNVHKVKVRRQRKTDNMTDVYERAFGERFSNLRQRAVFAYPHLEEGSDDVEPFYVFPTNGYRFLYSKEVSNSNVEYKQMVDTLFEQLDDQNHASEIASDLLKHTYSSASLREGLAAQSEIIFYGIPYYYAIRVAACPNYAEIIHNRNIK